MKKVTSHQRSRKTSSSKAAAKRSSQGSGREKREKYEGRLKALLEAVEQMAPELHRERALRPGVIVFRAPESEANFALRVGETGVQTDSGGDYGEPLLEVMGDPHRLQAILRGKKDARRQFFAGGIRVRGDMHYLSELGMRLGFLKTPII